MMTVEVPADEEKENVAPLVASHCDTVSTVSNISYNKELESHFGPIGMEFWNSAHGASLLEKMFQHVDKKQPAASVTSVGGHQFSNLTNCNITLTISDPGVAAGLLKNLQGDNSN